MVAAAFFHCSRALRRWFGLVAECPAFLDRVVAELGAHRVDRSLNLGAPFAPGIQQLRRVGQLFVAQVAGAYTDEPEAPSIGRPFQERICGLKQNLGELSRVASCD